VIDFGVPLAHVHPTGRREERVIRLERDILSKTKLSPAPTGPG